MNEYDEKIKDIRKMYRDLEKDNKKLHDKCNKLGEKLASYERTLQTIAKKFMTPEQLRKNAANKWGLSYEEALEMSYENVIELARGELKRKIPSTSRNGHSP